MNKFDFFGKYSVHPDTWLEFIWRMERKYNKRDNPFHNFYHGLTGFLNLLSFIFLLIDIYEF
jgi:cAMP-specific phosphodiesterase 4